MLNQRSDKMELLRIAEAVALEKSIDKEIILSSMELAIQKAAKTRFGSENDIRAKINRENGDITLHKVLTVVEKPENLDNEISLLDAKKAADMFSKVNTKILGIIENMSDFCCPNCDTVTKIFPGEGIMEESNRLNIPILGKLSIDPELALSMDKGLLYTVDNPDSEITKKYQQIANQVNNTVNKG